MQEAQAQSHLYIDGGSARSGIPPGLRPKAYTRREGRVTSREFVTALPCPLPSDAASLSTSILDAVERGRDGRVKPSSTMA